MHQILRYAGLACIVAVIVISVETQVFLRRNGAAENIERAVMYRVTARTVLVILALLLLVLSHLVG